ncbi:hypothetical protein [Campylobacter cuniculorum]|uniref:hypothetical protein n=1 Tax=Campylobacter cuniculorum TaxID=374106 RepID=UPI0023F27363|nr:hypothetical protein [Campylobacter cuniculorum]
MQPNEPFIDIEGNKSAKLFEWENEENIRFRAVTDMNHKIVTKGEGHSNTPLSPFDEIIITFYSDRNFKERMEFKNPLVKEYYKTKDINSTQENNQTHQTKNSNKYKFKRNNL